MVGPADHQISSGRMKLVRFGALLCCAAAATAALFGLTCGLLGMSLPTALQKLAANDAPYLFAAIIFADFYCLANDGLAWLSRDNPRRFGIEFPEMRFNVENDNNNTPIPLRSKLFGLYPLMIAIMWLAMAVTLSR